MAGSSEQDGPSDSAVCLSCWLKARRRRRRRRRCRRSSTTIYSRPTSFSSAADDMAARATSSSVASRPKPLSCRLDRCILRTAYSTPPPSVAATVADFALEYYYSQCRIKFGPRHAANQLASRAQRSVKSFRPHRILRIDAAY